MNPYLISSYLYLYLYLYIYLDLDLDLDLILILSKSDLILSRLGILISSYLIRISRREYLILI
jgi:hypothetical protein